MRVRSNHGRAYVAANGSRERSWQRRLVGFGFAAGIAATGATGIAIPATVAAAPASDQGMIEEVVVTARKREERLIDAPVAVSALMQEEVER